MDEHRPGRLKVWTPLLFSLILVFGMTLGFNLRDSLRTKRDIQTIIERNDRLEQIIDLIKEKYVDTVNANLLYQDAIMGILSHLDPHTTYIPTDEIQEVTEDLEGSFFGIGVEFSIIRDTIQVTSVVEQGPSERAGVNIGDQLIKVGDSTVAGTGITSERIIAMLKGKQNTHVKVTMKEPGGNNMKQVVIKRDVIPLFSVEAAIMLDETTGLIKIDRFAATTYEEFMKAMKTLKKQGMQQLIVDVRQNPGGYLDAATNIADEFLDGSKMIVYTQGKRSSRMEYKANKPGIFEQGRLAILVDESSASASEILAGAVQDWDRGIIVGRRTYGKGLVQEQYEMDDGAALRLTIAKYYTPSGRSIQRSYAMGKDAYAADFAHRFETGELTGYDTTGVLDTMRYYTSRKRVVYGSGGIAPDIYVPYDTARLSSGMLNILFSEDVKNAVWDYYVKNRTALKSFRTYKDFSEGFDADVLVNNYLSNINANRRKAVSYVLKQSKQDGYFRLQLKAQLARILYRNNGYYYISMQADNVVVRAQQALNNNQYLGFIGR
ncbi:MAG: S41 family peptidase [Sphingobacteriales bacterium]|nr:MAG: S41 family peptidase [Sphingobacteriales bacterium]